MLPRMRNSDALDWEILDRTFSSCQFDVGRTLNERVHGVVNKVRACTLQQFDELRCTARSRRGGTRHRNESLETRPLRCIIDEMWSAVTAAAAAAASSGTFPPYVPPPRHFPLATKREKHLNNHIHNPKLTSDPTTCCYGSMLKNTRVSAKVQNVFF